MLRDAAGQAASEADLLGVLTLGEGVRRALDQAGVAALADLERRGTFSERGYRSSAAALADLLGWERAEARGHLSAAEHVRPRVGLDGTPLPARLPATAAVFDAGAASVRHVEVVARVLGSDAAGRLDPQRWMAAEAQLASWIPDCTPTRAAGPRRATAGGARRRRPRARRTPRAVRQRAAPAAPPRRRRGQAGGPVRRRGDVRRDRHPRRRARRAAHRPRTTAPPPSARPRRWPTPAAGCSTTPTPPRCPPAVGVARS